VRLDASAEQKLSEHTWPGNIRELENVIHHALLICQYGVLGAEHLHLSSLNIQRRPAESEVSAHATPRQALETVLRELFNEPHEQMFELIEDTVMRTAFEFCHRNQVQAARLLGISRNILRSRLIKSREISALK
jgi:DNA-binding NtrC family response regulator